VPPIFKHLHLLVLLVLLPTVLYAQTIPGPADAGRINPEKKEPIFDHSRDSLITAPSGATTSPVPEGAKNVHFILHEVHLEGATVFNPNELREIYAKYLDTEISLDIVYAIADGITQRYRNAGYFLSLAYIPPQHIKDGIITIKIIEGAVGKVELNNDTSKNSVVQRFIKRLLAQTPLKADTLESFLLRLNDLPGLSFRAVLSPLEEAPEGIVKLTLVPTSKNGKGTISFDNFGSRYLGPNEVSASYSKSLLPLQQTTISGLASLPVDKLHYATLNHSVVIAPDLTFDMTGSITKAHPGYTLEPDDIKSRSNYLGASLAWQWIRQRQENLLLKSTIDGRDTRSDILDTPLTRDHVRTFRANAVYDVTDNWQGYNILNLTLSHGLAVLESSKSGDANLSNPNATPNFSKVEFSFIRQQAITNNWSLIMAGTSQLSSDPLYSSEQFGYGGQAFGRAYDASEITGDNGVSGSLELDYGGIYYLQPATIVPYIFYDIGTVWSKNGSSRQESGASVGAGLRATAPTGTSLNLGLAWPLTREISAPIYGEGKQGPRIQLQISQGF